ncbi:SH3 domain-containing protein [Bacillus toyonensis]|uniref:SH3 domain-containing protein n=3 Tax=Bacillus toyonensis TaxID=155322 RepID=UPI00077869E6|nr:SH3 domain-containing protein [Bacillus toyonensis]KXY18098.1 hypothetical protein AT259_21185 [Bacillus cereus]MCU5725380.1 SH3 domain-containing protein [Bacillus toyonensis]HDR3499122.1 SH3 domain-containing protein [Bacillus toyonensis]HDR7401888.1 SH3 domain-containing protein [Bacillus toyonensis]HDR7700638.1 SH3 domain-containing protein [Bacillus toyonensis]
MKNTINDALNLESILLPKNQMQWHQNMLNENKKSMAALFSIPKTYALNDSIFKMNWEQLLPPKNQMQWHQNMLNENKKSMTALFSIPKTYTLNDSIFKMNWEQLLPPKNQMQWYQDILKSFSYSATLIDTLRSVTIPASTLNILSTIDFDEIQPFLELEETQDEIEQELVSLQEQTNPNKIIDTINKWANQLIEFPDNLKQTAQAKYILFFVLYFMFNHLIAPAMEDVFKENVLHVSEFISNKPEENAKQVKTTLERDFGIARSAVNKVRVTNRETPVFRSQQRISGVIDTIPYNKPVIIIEKKRNWSFIMYTNSLDEEVNGWVFTGNLAK